MTRMLTAQNTALEGILPLRKKKHRNTASTMRCPKAKDFKHHDDTVMPYFDSRRLNIIQEPWRKEIFPTKSTIESSYTLGLFKNASHR